MVMFRIEAPQRRAMLRRGLVIIGMSAACGLSGLFLGPGALYGAGASLLLATIPVFFFVAARAAYTRLDGVGIRTRIYCFPTRTCPWAEVADIHVRLHPGPAGSARTIRVIRVDGGYFALGAPMTSAALRDDEFDAKARRILAQLASHVPDHAERVAAVATLSAPKSRRRRRIAGALVVLVMAFFLIDAVDESVTGVDLLAHGVRTTASVQAVDRSGRNPQYLLRVALAGGGSNDAWTGAVPGRHAVGETIAVAYSPSDPATVKSVTELGRWWIHPLLMVFIGAGLGWLGTVLWRLKPLWFLSRRGSSPAGSRGPER